MAGERIIHGGASPQEITYPELLRKKELYQAGRASIPELTLASYEQAFEIEYTHNSTAIRGKNH